MKRNKKTLGIILGFFILLGLTACPSSNGNASISFPSTLQLSTQTNQQTTGSFEISNTGTQELNFELSDNQSWLTLGTTTGSIAPSASRNITVNAACPDNAGSNTANIAVTSNASTSSGVSLEVSLNCSNFVLVEQGDYSIGLSFLGNGFNATREAVFQSAATRWGAVIVGDLSDITFTPTDGIPENSICGFAHNAFTTTIDDLIIFANISPIDGEGGILGQAGPSLIRNANGLTIAGCMQFDSADVAKLEAEGSFENVILHEMGHVLGIGSLWELPSKNLVDFTPSPAPNERCSSIAAFTTKPTFTGSNANAEFMTLGKTGNIPVEDEFGAGTKCGHWDEAFFDIELMTGFAEGPNPMPLSRMTIASLKDLGYTVDLAAADAYAVPGCSPDCPQLRTSAVSEAWEVILTPKGSLGPDGSIKFFDQ